MSFSSDLKVELSRINNLKNKQEVHAEFLGYLVTTNINVKGNLIKFSREIVYYLNSFAILLNKMYIDNYIIKLSGKAYSITFRDEKIIEQLDCKNIEKLLAEDNLKKAYVRGNFMGAGSINNPNNKYHLEIIFEKDEYANLTLNLLEQYGINSKILEKTLYIKDGEEISNFLALIGGNSAVLKFEEIRVFREMKNNVNRLVNCETANLNKTISASVKQIETIKRLKKSGKFNNLPEDLKEIANLRLENPDATLEQLGNMLKNPIGKSSVSHRFKKLEDP